MFGYVSVHKPELKVKEFEIYNAVYCGLCRHLGKTYGCLSKLCLNYDLTFLALLQSSLQEGCDGYEQKKCRANPFKKCTYCKNDSGFQDYAAAVCVSLTDLKLADNVADSGFLKSLIFRFLRMFSKKWSKKAFGKYPFLEGVLKDYQKEQQAAEGNPDCTLDLAAEPSAKALSRIFEFISPDEKHRFVLSKMGYCIGKWVYLCDVADDIEKDIKKGNFNPIKTDVPEGVDPKKYAEERLIPNMNVCFVECGKYSELLDYKKHKPIVDNIIYDGLKNRQAKIFKEEKLK